MKKLLFMLLFVTFSITNTKAQKLPLLKISNDKRYLVTENDEPFFWLGDTAWELLHRLNKKESLIYLNDRASKGFSVIQTVVLAELNGLNTPNANGDMPLINNDPTRLNEKYFEHVDFVIKQAQKRGLYIGLLPTWGDKFFKKWGVGPEIFTPENAEIYGELIAKRYLKQNNIVWILGGDRIPQTDEHYGIVRGMAKGIRKVDNKHLITFHPWGQKKATDAVNENWLDFDMYQSGHQAYAKDYKFVKECRAVTPTRPVVNGEPGYEDHPNKFDPKKGWLNDADVRIFAYWTMLSGAAGFTYGCHDIWQMFTTERTPVNNVRTDWQQAIHLPGSTQVMYMKNLLCSFPWQKMKNDQSTILNDNPEDSTYMVAAIGEKKDFLLTYMPSAKTIKIDLSRMNAQKINAYWYNPRSGKSKKIGEYKTTETPEFAPWSIGKGSDFVLVLIDSDATYKLPE